MAMVFSLGIAIGLGTFWGYGATKNDGQPKVGFNLLIYRRGNACLHIHHWMWMSAVAAMIGLVTFLSGGTTTPVLWFIYGVLLGASLTDLRYSDSATIQVPCTPQ